jgi:hypothetical protein
MFFSETALADEISLVRSSCPSDVDPSALSAQVELESGTHVGSKQDIIIRWAEPPCDRDRIRVSMRSGEEILAGTIELSTNGLTPPMQTRILALWIASSLRERQPPVQTVREAPPIMPEPEPIAVDPPRAEKTPATEIRRRTMSGSIFAQLAYAPTSTTTDGGGMVAFALRPLRVLEVRADAGGGGLWTARGGLLARITGGLAAIVPFDLTPSISLGVGARTEVSHIMLVDTPNLQAIGPSMLVAGGLIVRGKLCSLPFCSMVELEGGMPFAPLNGMQSVPGGPPESPVALIEGFRFVTRAGVSFE